MTARLVGARDLRRALKACGDSLTDLKETYAATAALVAAEAVTGAPRRTGRLAGSVKGNRATSKAVVNYGSARVPYAGVVHWGWPARSIKAQPFVVDAAQSTEPRWQEIFLDGIQAELDKVAAALPSV